MSDNPSDAEVKAMWLRYLCEERLPETHRLIDESWFDDVDVVLLALALMVGTTAVLARHGHEESNLVLATAHSSPTAIWDWLRQFHDAGRAAGLLLGQRPVLQ